MRKSWDKVIVDFEFVFGFFSIKLLLVTAVLWNSERGEWISSASVMPVLFPYGSHLVSVAVFDCIYFLTHVLCFSLVANLVFVFQSSFLTQEKFDCLCGCSVYVKDGCNLQLLEGALVSHWLMHICVTGDSQHWHLFDH